jgi:preprotein translocase subunit SecD
MHRVLPIFVVVLFVLALIVAIFPLPRPAGQSGDTLETKLGLDLIGGLRGEYQVVATDEQPVTPDILEQTRTIIENRVNASGISEPIVTTQGSDRISVEMPGIDDAGDIRQLIGTTGVLEFTPVPPDCAALVVQGGPQPECLDETEPLFNGTEIANSRIGQDPTTRQIVVDMELKSEGARLFDEYAAQVSGLPDNERLFAIVLDGIVQSAPTINAPRFGGQAQISGDFTTQEATDLVTVLKFGSLPLEIREVGFTSISATLGLHFLNQTILAGVIGIALVFAFMLLYYRVPGIVACIALIVYTILTYALFRLLGVTLTLAGIAAFILSVGMAVDANILIFERTKEELRTGKNLTASIEAGFGRAWNSILDSNVSTLITAFILYYFGTSVVKGFALVLIFGVLTSMFTAITLSRLMLRWVVQQPWARTHLFGIDESELAGDPHMRKREAPVRA